MEIVAELKQAFDQFKASQKEADQKVIDMIKNLESGTKDSLKEAKAQAEKAIAQVGDQAARILDLEQKMVKGLENGKQAPKSLGEILVEGDGFKDFAKAKSRHYSAEFRLDVFNNTIIGQSASPQSNEDTLVPSQYVPGIIPGAFRRLRIKDILPKGMTASNIILFTRELAWTNAAAETKEGGSKPESTLTFEQASTPVVTIAHFLKISKQVRDDAPAVVSYVNTRLRHGVDAREETQILTGNGTGQNLKGMTHTDNHTAFTPTVTANNALDNLNVAKYTLIGSDYYPTAIILNPADWGAIERLKVGSSDDRYLIGDPRNPIGPSLWGLPVIVSNDLTEGKFIMADFELAFMYWQRQETMVEMFEQDDTNVQKNLFTIRAEKRAALAGYVPGAVLYGDLTV